MRKDKLYPWELALLIALCLTLCVGIRAGQKQQALAGEVIRLHVIAHSDTPEDQAEKLQMRDRVLALLTPLLRGCETRDEAVNIISSHLDELEALGDVGVELGTEYYPTRTYGAFALPAGDYLSLRVTLGEGRGRNWWCVVFPTLCTEALAEGESAEDALLLLDEESADLITGGGPEYDLRFRVVELWGELKHLLS